MTKERPQKRGIITRGETEITTGNEAIEHLREVTSLLVTGGFLKKIGGLEGVDFSRESPFWTTVKETLNHAVVPHSLGLNVLYVRTYDCKTEVVFDYNYENGGRILRLLLESGQKDQNTDRVMIISVDLGDPDFLRTTYIYQGGSEAEGETGRINELEMRVISRQTEQGLKIRNVFTHLNKDGEFSGEQEI